MHEIFLPAYYNNMVDSDEFKIVNIVGGHETSETSEPYEPSSINDEAIEFFANEEHLAKSSEAASGPSSEEAAIGSSSSEEAAIGSSSNDPSSSSNEGGARNKTKNTQDPVIVDDDDDGASTVTASSEMGTASLIANGCTYTILEQMLMTEGDDGEKHNVAYMIERCAKALEGILGHLVSSSSSSHK